MKTKLIIPIILLLLLLVPSLVDAISVTGKIEPSPAYSTNDLIMSCNQSGGIHNSTQYSYEIKKDGVSQYVSSAWVSNTEMLDFDSSIYYWSATYFQMGSDWYVIGGLSDGIFKGFKWNNNTSQWVSNSSLVTGLVDVGTYSSPEVFNMGSNLYLITGANDGNFDGYQWSGTQWVVNSSIISGLSDVGTYSTPTVINDSGVFKLIAGESHSSASWNAWIWDGSRWNSNSPLKSGLVSGYNSDGDFFKLGEELYFIAGYYGNNYLKTYKWGGSSWSSYSALVPEAYGWSLIPSVFEKDEVLYLLNGYDASGIESSYKIPSLPKYSDGNFFNKTINSEDTEKGENWLISCKAIEIGNESSLVSTNITIQNYIPQKKSLNIINNSFLLTGSGNFVDTDEELLNYEYKWIKNNTIIQQDNSSSGDNWKELNSLVTGLIDIGIYSTLDVFLDGSTWKLIAGQEGGEFDGYQWSGTQWVANSSIISGLSDDGSDSTPTVFKDGDTWKLITGKYAENFEGYQWSGTTWVSNSSIISGISDVRTYSAPEVFKDGDTWKLIMGASSGDFEGYQWSGTAWIPNSSIVSGLGDVGLFSTPEVFKEGDTLKLISGEQDGVFNGFQWSGTAWIPNSSIVSGLGDVGSNTKLGFLLDGYMRRMIVGESGVFKGYQLVFTQNQTYNLATLDVSSPDFNKGDEIIFSTRATDFTDYSSWENSSVFTIPNRLPSVTTSILPSFTTSTMDLLGYANGTDADDSDSLIFDWEWYKDGVLNLSGSTTNLTQGNHLIDTLSSSLTSYGETWTFRCKANDGTANSSWINTTTFIDVYAPIVLKVHPENYSTNSSKNVDLNAKIDTMGLLINMTFLDESYNVLQTFNSISNNTLYSFNWLRDWYTNYDWYINLSYLGQNKLFAFDFTTKSQPLPTNYRISEINTSSIKIDWDNNTDIEWTSYTLFRNGEVDATGVTTKDSKVVIGLSENSDYTLQWQVGDSAPSESDYYNFSFRTEGWMPELDNWSYKRLITINSSDISSDIENGTINISLDNDNFKICTAYCTYPGWEVWGSGFANLNWTDGSDIRVTDYYETQLLEYNITHIEIGGDGGSTTQTIPDEMSYTGTWDNYSLCHDNDWNSRCIPNTYAEDYFNYTIPSGALTSSKLRSYIGEYYWDGAIPSGCFGGDKLRFKIVSNYTKPSAYIYCQDNSDDSWTYIYDNGNVSSYNYESMITWYFDGQLDLMVKPTHFNDGLQENTLGIDGDYDTKFWIYYGNSNALSSENESLAYSSLSNASYTVGTETSYVASAPVISNIDDSINKTATSTIITWDVDQVSNNKVIYATNEWFLDTTDSYWINSTMSPSINLTGLTTNTVYYYRVYSSSISSGLSSYTEGSLTFGTPPTTPSGRFYNYTEDRAEQQSTVCFEVTDMNSNANLDTSIQYWNEDSTTFNETVSNNINSIGLVCKDINLEYGKTYNYRLKMVGATTGYSSVYDNEFMPIQEFFAGSYIEDDMDYRHRQYCPNGIGTTPCYEQKGYREGSAQEEDWIWIETNITNEGSLSVEWYDGSSWSSNPMTLDDSGFYYKKLEGLNQSYQTFYIKSDTSVILNWTKPDLEHNNTGLRTETTKYVSFDNTQGSLDYEILYLDYELFYGTAFDHCILSGGGLFDCMSVSTYGYPYLDSDLVGTPYDRGRLARGGTINGGQVDTGLLKATPSTREIKEFVNNSWATMESSGRMCFAFSIYYWDLDKISEDNITSYYYRYWTQDEWWSTYYGYSQDRRYDYTCMRAYDDTEGDWGGFGDYNCLPDTITYGEKEILKVDNTAFNSTYSQTLVSDFKSGFNIDTSDDKLYDIVPYFDAQWTNQMINKYQQAYVIYNLPSNATLQGLDSDSDGINDYLELFTYYTNPKIDDTDNDGYTDGYEITEGTNPNLYYQSPPPVINITISDTEITYDETTIVSCNSDYNTYNTNFTITNSTGYVIFNTSVMNTTYEFIPTSDLIGNYSVYCYAENWVGNYSNVSSNFEVIDVVIPTCELVSVSQDIEANSTGNYEILINCSDPNGINATSFLLMRTVQSEFPNPDGNHWSLRPPNNNKGTADIHFNNETILLADGRGSPTFWYESLFNDTYTYATTVNTTPLGQNPYVTLTCDATSCLMNYSAPVEVATFPSTLYIARGKMESETKKEYEIYKDNSILVKFWDSKIAHGIENYTTQVFMNVNYTGLPNKDLLFYYCNSSFDISGGISPTNDMTNCIYLNSLTTTNLDTRVYTSQNSSYVKGVYSVNNGHIGGVKTTPISYGFLSSPVALSKPYTLRYVNGTTGTNVSFKDSKVAWTSIDSGDTLTQAEFTPDIWFSQTEDVSQFQIKLYVQNKLGYSLTNSTFLIDDIGNVTYPVGSPKIQGYAQGIMNYTSGMTMTDEDLNGTYTDNMTIHINIAIDPDAVGIVNHSLYLTNTDGTLNYTINSSFYSADDSDVFVYFNTKLVPSGTYRMNVTAVSSQDLTYQTSHLTENNFTIQHNQAPSSILNSPSDNYTFPTSTSSVTLNFTVSDPDNDPLNVTIYKGDGTILSNQIVSSGDEVTYVYSGLSTGNIYTWYYNISDGTTYIDSSLLTFKILKIDYSPTSASKSISSGEDTTITYSIQHNSDENISFNISFLTDLNTTYFDTSFSEDSFTVEPNEVKQITLTIDSESDAEELTYTGTTRIKQSNQNYDTEITINIQENYGQPTLYYETTKCTLSSSNDCYTNGVYTTKDSIEKSFKVKNTGDYELTNCQAILKGDLNESLVTFVPETFDLPISSTQTLSSLIAPLSVGSYYGYIDVICDSNGKNIYLESDNLAIINIGVINYSSTGSSSGSSTTTPVIDFKFTLSNYKLKVSKNDSVNYRLYINNTGNSVLDINLDCQGDLCDDTTFNNYSTNIPPDSMFQINAVTFIPENANYEEELSFTINGKPRVLTLEVSMNFKEKLTSKYESEIDILGFKMQGIAFICSSIFIVFMMFYIFLLLIPAFNDWKEYSKIIISIIVSIIITFIWFILI